MSLRNRIIHLAHAEPELRGVLLPLLERDPVTAVKTEKYNGVKFTWKQAKRQKGRAGIGQADQKYASWSLQNPTYPGVHIVVLRHNLDVMSYVTRPDEPFWKISIRVPSVSDDEKMSHGGYRELYVKKTFPAPEGSDDKAVLEAAMEFGFKVFLAEMAKRNPG